MLKKNEKSDEKLGVKLLVVAAKQRKQLEPLHYPHAPKNYALCGFRCGNANQAYG